MALVSSSCASQCLFFFQLLYNTLVNHILLYADVGSLAATIMYAFYLNETLGDDHICTVPVINMRRADFGSHVDLKWLLNSCQIDEASLVFIDEVFFRSCLSNKYILLINIEINAASTKYKRQNLHISGLLILVCMLCGFPNVLLFKREKKRGNKYLNCSFLRSK